MSQETQMAIIIRSHEDSITLKIPRDANVRVLYEWINLHIPAFRTKLRESTLLVHGTPMDDNQPLRSFYRVSKGDTIHLVPMSERSIWVGINMIGSGRQDCMIVDQYTATVDDIERMVRRKFNSKGWISGNGRSRLFGCQTLYRMGVKDNDVLQWHACDEGPEMRRLRWVAAHGRCSGKCKGEKLKTKND